jgi:hypothetical protein
MNVRQYTLLILLLAFYQIPIANATPQVADSASQAFQPDYMLIVTGWVGGVYGVSASEFFKEYQNPFTIGGQASTFNIPLSYGASVKAAASPDLRYGLNGEFFKAVMQDNYTQQVVIPANDEIDTIGARTVGSGLSVSSVPIIASIEYIPVESQFATYFGIGAGISFNKIYWSETVASTISNDPRRGGEYVNESNISPAARIYAGVELDFDKRRRAASILGSLLLEVRYTYIPVSAPLLKQFSSFPGAPARWSEDFQVGGSGLGLSLGISVEFPGYFKK